MTGKLNISLASVVLTACALWAQNTPPMQPGIRVDMAVSEHATPAPEADEAKAWIVTITRDGKLFFRANQTTPTELLEFMKSQPRNRDAKFYVKADSLAPYANVTAILDEGRESGFETAVLLTSQPAPLPQSGVAPPMGFDVRIGPTPSTAPAVLVIKTTHATPQLKINSQQVPASAFPRALNDLLLNQKDKTVVFRADPRLPYLEIVHQLDVCRSAGATLAINDQPK